MIISTVIVHAGPAHWAYLVTVYTDKYNVKAEKRQLKYAYYCNAFICIDGHLPGVECNKVMGFTGRQIVCG